jgi:signal peptidase II
MYLTVVYNDGAAWSLLAGHRFLLTALAPGTLLLGIFFRRYLGLNRAINRFSLGLIAGGICGNFLDRLRTGYVVDFIDVRLPFYRWPTFNVADSALCLGAFLFLVANQRPPAPADQLPKK